MKKRSKEKNLKIVSLSLIGLIILSLIYGSILSEGKLSIEYKSSKDGSIQVFYDNHKGENSFDEEHSARQKIENTENDFKTISVPIMLNDVNKIRIDIDDIDQKIEVKKIYLSVMRVNIKSFLPIDIMNEFNVINDGEWNCDNQVLTITPKGNDLFFYNTNLKLNLKSTVIILIMASIAAGLILLIGKVLYSKINKIKSIKIRNRIYYFGFLTFISILFFQVQQMFTFDSVWYFTYLDFFEGIKPLSEWPAVRGFMFPFILWAGRSLFGANSFGINVTFYIFYLIQAVYLIKLFNILTGNYSINKSIKYILIFFMFLINPMFYAYYHIVLTEGISITYVVVFTYYAFKNYIYGMENDKIGKKRIICYIAFVSMFSVIVWFTKEMFFTIPIFIFISFEVLVLIKKFSIKKLLVSVGSLLIVISILATSISCFKSIVNTEGNDVFGPRIFAGMRYFVVGEYGFLEELTGEKTVSVVNENYEAIDTFKYNFDDKNKSLKDYYLYCLKNYPYKVIQGYIDNYIILCGIYESLPYIDKNGATIVANVQNNPISKNNIFTNIISHSGNFDISGENKFLALNLLKSSYNPNNDFASRAKGPGTYYTQKVEVYTEANSNNIVKDFISGRIYSTLAQILYSLCIFIQLPLFIISTVFYCKSKRREMVYFYGFNAALCAFSFVHTMELVIGSTVIDRYMIPAYAAMLVVCANYLLYIINSIKNRKSIS